MSYTEENTKNLLNTEQQLEKTKHNLEEQVEEKNTCEQFNSKENVEKLSEDMFFTEHPYLFVVSIDKSPTFYFKDEKTASKKMWDVASKLSYDQFASGYKTNYIKIGTHELHIVGSYRFYLVSYEKILHRVSYHRVKNTCI